MIEYVGAYAAFAVVEDDMYTVKKQDTSRLMSEKFSPNTFFCLTFWYFNVGRAPGNLRIYMKNAHDIIKLREIEGSEEFGRKVWKVVQVDIFSTTSFNIIIEAISHPQREGVVAIDDVIITHGYCPGTCTTLSPTARVKCGPEEVTAESCVEKFGCCYDGTEKYLAKCFREPSVCESIKVNNRVRCGDDVITEKVCVQMGCCWDGQGQGVGNMTCYISPTTPTHTPTQLTYNFEQGVGNFTVTSHTGHLVVWSRGQHEGTGTSVSRDHTMNNGTGKCTYKGGENIQLKSIIRSYINRLTLPVKDRSKFTGYLGRGLGKICLKKSLRPRFFSRKKVFAPLIFSEKKSSPPFF